MKLNKNFIAILSVVLLLGSLLIGYIIVQQQQATQSDAQTALDGSVTEPLDSFITSTNPDANLGGGGDGAVTQPGGDLITVKPGDEVTPIPDNPDIPVEPDPTDPPQEVTDIPIQPTDPPPGEVTDIPTQPTNPPSQEVTDIPQIPVQGCVEPVTISIVGINCPECIQP